MEIRRIPPVKRCAILIGNDRWGGNFLPGVEKDMSAMRNFLLNPGGGAWEESEIHIFSSPISKPDFVNWLKDKTTKDEYFFIYFSGHGELSRIGTPLFVLPGADEITLDEIQVLLRSKSVLMISDSCQGIPVYQEGGSIMEGIRLFSDTASSFKARRAFDRELRKLPPMFTYASAVSPSQYASDSDLGGIYTFNLLSVCRDILKSDDEKGVYGICYPHALASMKVAKNTQNQQRPCISGYTRTFQPPFLVKL